MGNTGLGVELRWIKPVLYIAFRFRHVQMEDCNDVMSSFPRVENDVMVVKWYSVKAIVLRLFDFLLALIGLLYQRGILDVISATARLVRRL
jgi:hypothetical protein